MLLTSDLTLGVMEFPSLDPSHELSCLQSKVDTLANAITRMRFSEQEMWTFYHSIYTKSIGYSHPITNLS